MPEITPYSGPKLAQLPQFQGQHAEDLYWSTYRPGQYFGTKPWTFALQNAFWSRHVLWGANMHVVADRHADKDAKGSSGRLDVV